MQIKYILIFTTRRWLHGRPKNWQGDLLWFKVKKVMYIHIFCLLASRCKQQEALSFFYFDDKNYHLTHDNTHICLLLKVLPRTFTHNVFCKGVQHVKLPADNQKSLAYMTVGSTGTARQKLWKLWKLICNNKNKK